MGSYGTLAQSWNILYLCTQLYLQTPGVRSDGVILYPCTKLEYPYFYTQLYLQTYGVRGDGVMLYPCTKLVCPVSLHTYIILFRYLESGQIGSYCALAQSWMSCICTSSHLESACPHSLQLIHGIYYNFTVTCLKKVLLQKENSHQSDDIKKKSSRTTMYYNYLKKEVLHKENSEEKMLPKKKYRRKIHTHFS